MSKHAWMASSKEEYTRYKLSETNLQKWEDGLRTTESKGSYEWWYFDSKLNDGSSLVITFFTGPIASFSEGFKPYATFTHTKANGEKYDSKVYPINNDYEFSKEQCDVRIGKCTFKGNMKEYEIYWTDENIEAKIKLKGNVPSWRPYTGHILFNTNKLFAWLPSIPEGNVSVDIKSNNNTTHYTGTGYHDHNWGNIPMFFVMHHWYWGRAKIGDYQIVSSYITANKEHNYDEIPIFMIAKDGEILADKADKFLTYTEEDYYYDSVIKKHVANRLIYDYDDGTKRYRITYNRENDLEKMGMETQLTKLQYVFIWFIGLRGAYQRMQGKVTLEVFENNEIIETITSSALWELMYFGKDRIRQ